MSRQEHLHKVHWNACDDGQIPWAVNWAAVKCPAIRVRPDMQGLYVRHVKLRRNGNSIVVDIATMSNPVAVPVQFVLDDGCRTAYKCI